MAAKKYYGIKFPFTTNNNDGFFIDMNETYIDKKASEILHVLLTPIRSRIRKPDFGTNLIKHIYYPNNGDTFDLIKKEAIESVNRYVKNVNLTDIQILNDENDDHSVFLDLKYTTNVGNTTQENELGVKL